MKPALELVSDRSAAGPDAGDGSDGAAASRLVAQPRDSRRRLDQSSAERGSCSLLDDERGAVTAEYAIVIMAAVAFAGLLVAIMRSAEIREMLVGLVEKALGAGG